MALSPIPWAEVGPGVNNGLKMMMDQVNMSRLSHGVRAAAMMRRCLNEAMVVARNRIAFGEKIIDKPLLRRQLMKLMVPTEQVLSMALFVARQLDLSRGRRRAGGKAGPNSDPAVEVPFLPRQHHGGDGGHGSAGRQRLHRGLDQPKLVRDAHTGVLWEGTSNINALDVTKRAIAKVAPTSIWPRRCMTCWRKPRGLPGQFKGELDSTVDRAVAFAEQVALSGNEPMARKAADALYHATSAVLLAVEGARLGAMGEDARRLILARMVMDHRLRAGDPLAIEDDDRAAVAALLGDENVDLATAQALGRGLEQPAFIRTQTSCSKTLN